MRPTQRPVFRLDSLEETPAPYPTLASATVMAPRTAEACIVTSLHGVHLADAIAVGGHGGVLVWALTLAGRDVADAGWSAEAPTLSERERDTVLATALREDFEAVS